MTFITIESYTPSAKTGAGVGGPGGGIFVGSAGNVTLDSTVMSNNHTGAGGAEGGRGGHGRSGTGWANMGGTVDSGANCVSPAGVTDLSDWTPATEMPTGTKPKFYLYLPAVIK